MAAATTAVAVAATTVRLAGNLQLQIPLTLCTKRPRQPNDSPRAFYFANTTESAPKDQNFSGARGKNR
jgi:hypothetical protein